MRTRFCLRRRGHGGGRLGKVCFFLAIGYLPATEARANVGEGEKGLNGV